MRDRERVCVRDRECERGFGSACCRGSWVGGGGHVAGGGGGGGAGGGGGVCVGGRGAEAGAAALGCRV